MKTKQIIWLVVAIAVFAAAGFLGVQSAMQAGRQATDALQQLDSLFASADYEPCYPEEDFVARVDIVGTIMPDSGTAPLAGGYSHSFTLDYIDSLIDCESNVGMLLYIDSPGGAMNTGDELYLKLMDYKEETGRPIYCYFNDMACSGGYYAAMCADEICANRNSMCVNIGVYISTYNFSELFSKLGVEQKVFRSSPNKGIGMPGVEWTEEQEQIYQDMVDIHYAQFVDIVAKGRGMTPEEVMTLDDGREMLAPQALEAGFIDSIGRYEDYEAEVLSHFDEDVFLYTAEAELSPLMELINELSALVPRSDAQVLQEFAEAHSGLVVMACADEY